MASVLIVDDDQNLSKMLQRTLIYEGLNVMTAANGQEAIARVHGQQPDIIILDWMMPKMDGLSVVRQLRAENNQTMILMLTARDAIENRVEGLESGADDYLVKPFASAELVARIHVMLRRIEARADKQSVSCADLTLDPATHEARRGGILLTLSPTEFDLLHFFMRHPYQVLERGQILTSVWGYDFGGDANVLDVYIGYLRKKLEANGQSRLLHTTRGIGFILREE
jgi:two-component system response regulator MprA